MQNLKKFREHLPESSIFLYLNEVEDKTDILDKCAELNVEPFVIDNQKENGGLTGTWNMGIRQCAKKNCSVVILSNDDLFIDETIKYIVNLALKSYKKKKLFYYGPVSNNPGVLPSNCCQLYSSYNKNEKICFTTIKGGLNGFFLVFPMNSLDDNKYDNINYFNPNIPFGGNETEWYKRFSSLGGKGIIVPSTFVYHYKLNLWKTDKKICYYTVNTQDYEDNIIKINTSCDFFYFTDNNENVKKCIDLDIKPILVEKSDNPKLQQRLIKSGPHKYLPKIYTTSIYIDANVIPKSIFLENQIKLMDNIDLIVAKHPARTQVLSEAHVVVDLFLEKAENVAEILKMQSKDNFCDDIGLSETAVLIRNHHNLIEFSNEWSKCIKICIRDQISFDYLLSKHNIKFYRYDTNEMYSKKRHNFLTESTKRRLCIDSSWKQLKDVL